MSEVAGDEVGVHLGPVSEVAGLGGGVEEVF